MCYSVQHIDWIFVKEYELLPFTKNMGKDIGKNISKNVSGKYSQKSLDHAKTSATDTLNIFQKDSCKKQQKNRVVWVVLKWLIELRKFKKNH